ncbi:MAG: glycosyltransferase family 4 protein, partial [Acidimicrobiia bacterium]|nr:glycosyltransferase family 4 protein [Acidimicrobiia bacterium]
MRILVVADGLEPLLRASVIGLAERGHQVRVVGALGPHELGAEERFRLRGALVVTGGEPGGPVRQAVRTAGRLAGAASSERDALGTVATRVRRHEPRMSGFRRTFRHHLPVLAAMHGADVVWFEAAYTAAEHLVVLDQLPPKLVMCTGSDVRIMPDLSRRLADALPAAFAQTARVLCRSDDLRRHAIARGASPARTAVLRPAVDTSYFRPGTRPPRPGDAVRLVTVGREHWVKGHEDLVQAVALARHAGHDVTLTMVGADKGAGDALTFAIKDLGLTDVVQRIGSKSVAGTRSALVRSDVFVMSSRSEGVSRAALEAMAVGLPVITTDVGGMREIVDDGVEGALVPARDPAALAHAIGALAADPALRAEMGAHAVRRASA